MLPYKTLLHLDRNLKTPLYVQLANELIQKISSGIIPRGMKLPGGRKMATLFEISRRTVILAYEEMEAQGWIQILPAKGAVVNANIPVPKRNILLEKGDKDPQIYSGFSFSDRLDFLEHYIPPSQRNIPYVIDTGYPDVRLAPLKELSQAYHRVLTNRQDQKFLNYASDFYGHDKLRNELVKSLSETRGIKVDIENLIVSRGSLMAFTNIFQVLLDRGDKVAVGEVSFLVANNIIKIAGGDVVKVPVDENGIDVDALDQICKSIEIKAVFVMPHHHHPTTVSLSASRRIKLLNLAVKYQFAIVEDDYDYDFHYSSSPILPMASADQHGVVIYVGSFSKTVAPGLRTGFVVAPKDFIRQMSRLSRFMDVHGNAATEKALAYLMAEGIVRRHLKKSLKTYRKRRDLFTSLLKDQLEDAVDFKIPEGGLAAWVTFKDEIDLPELRKEALTKGLLISRTVFRDKDGKVLNAIRMGFASLDEEEINQSIALLKKSIDSLVKA